MNRVAISNVAEVNPPLPASVRDGDGARLVPFLPMSAVSEEGFATYAERRPLHDLLKGYTYFGRGDVIVAKITPCLENGKAANLGDLPDSVGFGSTEFHVLRPGPDIDARYLFHAVWNNAFRRAGADAFTGSAGQKRLPASFFDRYRIPLPPLAEQRRIAAMLDKADEVRRKRREAIGLLDEFLRSVFLEMFGDPVSNEKGWEVARIGDVVVDAQYGTSVKANQGRRGLPILRMNNLTQRGTLDLSDLKWCEIAERELSKYTVRRGDLLFNRTNSPELVGKTAVWDRDEAFAFAGYLIRLRLDQLTALPEYVSGYLNSAYGKRLLLERAKPSINMSNISAGVLKRLPIVVPVIAAQQRYVALVKRVRASEARMERYSYEVDHLFDSLSDRLLRTYV